MQIRVEPRNGVLIIRIVGRIDGSNVLDFEDTVRSATSGRECPIVIDCHELSFISSVGLRSVLQIARWQEALGEGFALCSLSPPVLRTFQTSGFHRIIWIHDDLEEALVAVKG